MIPEVRNIYPLTVTVDRYSGAYSKGKWLAFALDPEDIPKDPFGDDCVVMEFWCGDEKDKYLIGKGETIEKAIADLDAKHIEKHHVPNERFCPKCGEKL
jgi:hypothetical protein